MSRVSRSQVGHGRLTDGGTLDLFSQLPGALPPRLPEARRLQPARDPPRRLELHGVVLEITRKRVTHLRLSVHPPVGTVRISAPLRMSVHTIRSFVIAKLDWIRRQQKKLQASERPAPDAYLDGERHAVWGQPCPLVVVEQDARPVVELKDGTIYLRVRPGSSARQRQEVLTGWHRALIETTAPPLVARWEPLMRVTVARLSARPMKTRWGSCTPRTRQIRLSTELAKKSPECLEYVVVHEMVHLLEASHNRRFVRLMDQFLPGWRARRAELNGPRTRG